MRSNFRRYRVKYGRGSAAICTPSEQHPAMWHTTARADANASRAVSLLHSKWQGLAGLVPWNYTASLLLSLPVLSLTDPGKVLHLTGEVTEVKPVCQRLESLPGGPPLPPPECLACNCLKHAVARIVKPSTREVVVRALQAVCKLH